MNKIRCDNTSYMLFVMGYDLLQKKLTSYEDCPCDGAYNICIKIYDEFLDSEENQQEKGEYECLQDWIKNHTEMIDGFIKQEFEIKTETKHFTFRGREISYDYSWIDDEIFVFSLGDGEFKDEDGDYYIEFEYYVPENDWTISIIWESDRAVIGELNEPDKYITVDEMETVMNFAEQFID